MNKLVILANRTSEARGNGHSGLFTTQDLALMLDVSFDSNFRKYLHKAVKAEVLISVCRNIYINPAVSPDENGILERIAQLLRWNKLNYVSLESELSRLGIISQVMMNYLTVMTTGRSGKIKTLYGTIEFTHTKRTIKFLSKGIYYDPDSGIFRANEERASSDLRRIGRNIQMLEEREHVT
ncbi:MAG: hypothetical protein L3J46_04985 [Kangiellaceae bacterium]|nr:hypothetical protein [Kangiellaceae bacterium]